jgi:hypothetical protein
MFIGVESIITVKYSNSKYRSKKKMGKLNFILFIVSTGCLFEWSRIQDVKKCIGKNVIQLFYSL